VALTKKHGCDIMSHREVAKDQPPNIHIKLNREKKGGTRADEISSRVCV